MPPIKSLFFVILFITFPLSSQATILNIQGGLLTGAYDINIFDKTYRVDFVNGSCQSLFSGCDEITDFTWQSRAESDFVYNFMLNNVFVDMLGLGSFRSDINSIFGCQAAVDACFVQEPFFVDSSFPSSHSCMFHVLVPGNAHGGGWSQCQSDYDTNYDGNLIFAVWSVTSEHEPPNRADEPSTILFLIFGWMIYFTLARFNLRNAICRISSLLSTNGRFFTLTPIL